MRGVLLTGTLAALPVATAAGRPVTPAEVTLKTGPDRVKTPLQVNLKRIGTVRPRSTDEIRSSNWVIGCETLDRDFANFDQYKRFLKPLGIKALRLQGGWYRCEKEKGKYDFGWLDKQVDFALANGINPTLETSYGNQLYEGGSSHNLAIGGFPSGEGRVGWNNWVRALARHFKGRVRDWLMWNEPDNALYEQPERMPELTAEFNVGTAKIILEEIPDARIGAICASTYGKEESEQSFGKCLDFMGKDRDLFAWIVYHGYGRCPDAGDASIEFLKEVLAKRGIPASKLWQGEAGCPSEATACGPMSQVQWSEYSQAKWDMRRMLGDLGHDVRSLVYSICDLQYTDYPDGKPRHNPKGLLRTNDKCEVVGVKCAYYAVQNVVSVFDDTVEHVRESDVENQNPFRAIYEFRKDTGARIYAFWTFADYSERDPRDKGLPTIKCRPFIIHYIRPDDAFDATPCAIRTKNVPPLEDPVFVDLLTGAVYEYPRDLINVNSEGATYLEVPTYDSPCLLTERAALDYVPVP